MNAPSLSRQCVYMLTDGVRVKIGTTADLKHRIAALSGACGTRLEILRVIDHAGRRVERWLHRKFDAQRHHGEWFSYHPDMLTIQPPEEAASIPRVEVRRDVRLTLKERLTAASRNADLMGLTYQQRLMILAQQCTEAEAEELCAAIMALPNPGEEAA